MPALMCMELTSGCPSFLRTEGRELETKPSFLHTAFPAQSSACCWPPLPLRSEMLCGKGSPLASFLPWPHSHLSIQASCQPGKIGTCKLFFLRFGLTLCGFHRMALFLDTVLMLSYTVLMLSLQNKNQERWLWFGCLAVRMPSKVSRQHT